MQNKMLSLFDYLSYAAGKELGEQVAKYAKIKKTEYSIRHISNPKYTGDVMLYTKEFLDEFFQVEKIFADNTDYTELNTLLAEEAFNNDKNKVF